MSTWSTTWLRDLSKDPLDIQRLPEDVRFLGKHLCQVMDRPGVPRDAGKFVAVLCREILKERVLKARLPISPEGCQVRAEALIILDHYILPAVDGYPRASTQSVRRDLVSEEWLREHLPDASGELVVEMRRFAAGMERGRTLFHDRQASGETRLREEIAGIRGLTDKGTPIWDILPGLRQAVEKWAMPAASAFPVTGSTDIQQMTVRPIGRTIHSKLPSPYVERQGYLAKLDEVVLQAVEHGSFVVLCGMARTGKSYLVAGLLDKIEHDEHLRQVFRDGVVFAPAIRRATSPQDLARQQAALIDDLAAQLNIPIPPQERSLERRLAVFHEGLQAFQVLIVVEDCDDSQVVLPLKDAPVGVGVLATTRYQPVADALAPLERQILVRGLEVDETFTLAQQTGIALTDETRAILRTAREFVEGHPYALWAICEQARQGRWLELDALLQSPRLNYWKLWQTLASFPGLEDLWQEITTQCEVLDKITLQRLAVLCNYVLRCSFYDADMGKAIWGRGEVAPHAVFERLVAGGIIERIQEGYYRLSPFFWHIARGMGDLDLWRKLHGSAVCWRYPLGYGKLGWVLTSGLARPSAVMKKLLRGLLLILPRREGARAMDNDPASLAMFGRAIWISVIAVFVFMLLGAGGSSPTVLFGVVWPAAFIALWVNGFKRWVHIMYWREVERLPWLGE